MKPPEFFGRFFNHGIARKIRLFPVGAQHGYLMAPFPQKAVRFMAARVDSVWLPAGKGDNRCIRRGKSARLPVRAGRRIFGSPTARTKNAGKITEFSPGYVA